MKILIILLALLSFNSYGSDLDSQLRVYVKMFGLKPMSGPGPVNEPLFFLGRDLFFEKQLSGNKNISCADCHHPMNGTHDGLPLGVGEGATGIMAQGGRLQAKGKILARNSQALFNLHAAPMMFWDGRVDATTGETPEKVPYKLDSALELQALFPMVNHDEMLGQKGSNELADSADSQEAWEKIFKRIYPIYKARLELNFPSEKHSMAHIVKAIAHFESQAFAANNTPYDDYLKGNLEALSEVQKIGMDIFFGKGRCGECHSGEHLTDFTFHNVGVPQIGPGLKDGDDKGRWEIDPRPENMYAFRVPGLRNVSMTAPYMHNGAFKTIAQIIEHYDDIDASLTEYQLVNNLKSYVEKLSGPLTSTNEAKLNSLSPKLQRQLKFEESEEKALVEFVRVALTDKRFLKMEVDGDYISSVRLQLTGAGFEKIRAHIPQSTPFKNTDYFYFDVLTPVGHGLRELERPIKLYITRSGEEATLFYRRQLHKTSGAVSGVVAGASFEDEELKSLSGADTEAIENLCRDFYAHLYQNHSAGIPPVLMTVMKGQVEDMNRLWHSFGLKNMIRLSDELNKEAKDIFFVPTSMNSKEEWNWKGEGDIVLQRSQLRDENGGHVTTWAVEMKLGRMKKAELDRAVKDFLSTLVEMGLSPDDAKGTTPGPSKLTERVLLQIFPG